MGYKKAEFFMFLAKKLFNPEIIFENEAVQGRDLKTPCVIICNHSVRTFYNRLSIIDGPMIRYVFKNTDVSSLMGEDLMQKPVFRLLVSGMDCIPVNRHSASTEWIHKCKEKLNNGVSVIIFPEGTTIKHNAIEPFKPGFALLARIAGVPVLPVAVNGVYRPFTKRKLKIRVGVPVSLQAEKSNSAALQKEAERFRCIVEEMYLSFDSRQKTDTAKKYIHEKSEVTYDL